MHHTTVRLLLAAVVTAAVAVLIAPLVEVGERRFVVVAVDAAAADRVQARLADRGFGIDRRYRHLFDAVVVRGDRPVPVWLKGSPDVVLVDDLAGAADHRVEPSGGRPLDPRRSDPVVYVVDAGTVAEAVRPETADVRPSWTALPQPDVPVPPYWCRQHGTYVSSIVAESLARGQIQPVEVMCAPAGFDPVALLDGFEWIASAHPPTRPGVVNLSLGLRNRPSTAAASAALADRGLYTVWSAGNDGRNECDGLTGRLDGRATVVGAIDDDGAVMPWSNVGGCVDAFVNGGTARLWDPQNERWRTARGTSFTAPRVAAWIANHLDGGFTPDAARTRLLQAARRGGYDVVTAVRMQRQHGLVSDPQRKVVVSSAVVVDVASRQRPHGRPQPHGLPLSIWGVAVR